MGDWTNNYFGLPDENIIDPNHDTVKVHSFNSKREIITNIA
jgi:hypothetical protein